MGLHVLNKRQSHYQPYIQNPMPYEYAIASWLLALSTEGAPHFGELGVGLHLLSVFIIHSFPPTNLIHRTCLHLFLRR